MSLLTIDLDNNPNLHFRIDNFSVPDEAREEFEYKAIGFDRPARLARWGGRAELGNFSAPRGMQ